MRNLGRKSWLNSCSIPAYTTPSEDEPLLKLETHS